MANPRSAMHESMGITMRLVGVEKRKKRLDRLEVKVQKKIVGKAVSAAAKPMLKAAKANAPVLTGLLKLAMATASRTYRKSGSIVAVIGPRFWGAASEPTKLQVKRFAMQKTAAKRARAAKAVPAWYAHLVEGGTKYVPGKGGGARAQPFMKPAFDRTKHRSLRIMRVKLWQGIRAEVKKI